MQYIATKYIGCQSIRETIIDEHNNELCLSAKKISKSHFIGELSLDSILKYNKCCKKNKERIKQVLFPNGDKIEVVNDGFDFDFIDDDFDPSNLNFEGL